MLEFRDKYRKNFHSQNGEDGVILEAISRIPELNEQTDGYQFNGETGQNEGFCVEIGANDGLWLSNTRCLIEKGWSACLIEADAILANKAVHNWAENPKVLVMQRLVTSENVNELVDSTCDVLSTDTDGADYDIFAGLEAKPKIVIIEIDSSLDPTTDIFNSDGGAGYKPMVELGLSKGYFLLCHTGNLIFVDKKYKKLFPEIKGDPIKKFELYFDNSWITS